MFLNQVTKCLYNNPITNYLLSNPKKDESIYSFGQTMCLLCREDLEKNTLDKILTCEHVFHLNCFNDFLRSTTNPSCPICRKVIKLPGLSFQLFWTQLVDSIDESINGPTEQWIDSIDSPIIKAMCKTFIAVNSLKVFTSNVLFTMNEFFSDNISYP